MDENLDKRDTHKTACRKLGKHIRHYTRDSYGAFDVILNIHEVIKTACDIHKEHVRHHARHAKNAIDGFRHKDTDTTRG